MHPSLRRILLPCVLGAAALALAACEDDPSELAQTAQKPRGPAVAKCAITIGEVEVRRAAGGEWMAIAAGAEFERGDLIRTGKGAFVSVRFKTGGGFELEQNSLMIIRVAEGSLGADAGTEAPKTVLALQSGTARGVFDEDETLLAPLVIEEEDGTQVSVAPTGKEAMAFRLSKTQRGTEVAVSTGTAVLTTKLGKRVSIEKGQAADVRRDGAVSEVVELLDYPPSLAPGVDARFHFEDGLTIPLAWKGVPGASKYRLQVARDLGFQSMVTNVDVASPGAAFKPPEAGTFAWRVAAVDASGRTGEFGFARRIFAEREEPQDLLLAPEDGASYAFDESRPPPILFAWQSAANAIQYRLVVARTPDLLDGPVVDRRLGQQRAEITSLEPGEYYWGVYLSDGSPVPVFNRPRKLVVVKSTKATFQTPKTISKWGKKKR